MVLRFVQPSWYAKAESWLEPSYGLMVAVGIAIIVVTIALMLSGEKTPLAAWLVYLLMP